MPADHFVRDGKEAAVRTICTFDSRFFTDTTNPFIATRRRITGSPGLPALETAGINIFPSSEKRLKQLYLGSGWRTVCDKGA